MGQISDIGSTGYLFRQPIVTTHKGETCRLDDLLGAGFALVYKGNLSLTEHSKKIIARLNIKLFCTDKLREQQSHLDNLFKQHQCALIRPDRIVYGHTTDVVDKNKLRTDLAVQLLLTLDSEN